MPHKHTILCVDDEQHNLDALYRTLRREYNVVTALSGDEGLNKLKENKFSLIITDQRMPKMTGVEFLEQSLELCPDIPRIILTGFTDVEDLIGAINTGRVYRYITKPWDPNDLTVTIKRAIESLELTMENRRLFDDLIRMEKLATVGQVAAGIAHEVKNQLSVMTGIQIVQEKYAEDELVGRVATRMMRAQDRIVNILDGIKSFARQNRETIFTRPIKANDLIQQTVYIVEMDPDVKGMTLDLKLNTSSEFHGDREKLIQVLINLIRNAAHAMNGEGTVTISAHEDDNEITISVADSGCGIPQDILEKIWQPFFTTKTDKGTGLGLSICKRIIDAHGGELHCQTEKDKGTTFSIVLPKTHKKVH